MKLNLEKGAVGDVRIPGCPQAPGGGGKQNRREGRTTWIFVFWFHPPRYGGDFVWPV